MNELLKVAWNNIKNAKVRSFLTVLGITIGMVAVVALISVGQGMEEAINEQLKSVGSNRIIVTPGGPSSGFASFPLGSRYSSARLTESDVEAVKRVPGVVGVVGVLLKNSRVQFGDRNRFAPVMGIHTDPDTMRLLDDISYFRKREGRFLNYRDTYKATIGYDVAENFFDREIRIGDKLEIEGHEFEVVGINVRTGNPLHDSKVAIPIDAARELFEDENIDMIFVTVKEGLDMDKVADAVKRTLRRNRNVKEGEEDFTVQTARQLAQRFASILGMVQLVLVGIAMISLFVGGTGIMSTMYTSVLERTKDIGVMKAVGATNRDVMMIFIMESGLLGLIGGVAGLLIGFGLGKVVEVYASYSGFGILKSYISPELAAGVLLFALLVGTLSGLMPARRAVLMNPVEALRDE